MGDRMRYSEAPHTEGRGWAAVIEALDRIEDGMGQRHTENTSSLEVVQRELQVVIERVDDLARGFPDNDPDGHRREHEAQIRKTDARTRLYEKLYEELASKGVLALILFIGSSVIYYAAAKLHLGGKW
jgi:hypothetical protein